MPFQESRKPIDAYDRLWMPDESFWEKVVPARVIRPSRVAVQGYAASRKGGLPTKEAEASLEHDLCTQLEVDPRVYRYALQPFSLIWRDDSGRQRQYTPDAFIDFTESAKRMDPTLYPMLVEVKPFEIIRRDWTQLRPRFKMAFHWAYIRGFRFKVLTERHLRGPRLENSRFLLRFRDCLSPPPPEAGASQKLVWNAIEELEVTTPNQLLDAIGAIDFEKRAQMIPYIWHSLFSGLICADLDKKLTMNSKIWSPRALWP
ncbi:MAG: TnsA endonuclease N-terminal domain-containing protein [Burkholderiales bacterium]|nr:TnsA endonuclease N-terminal domain-containing protein [Burkholderiales bacterium]